jgi:hypothetical protein
MQAVLLPLASINVVPLRMLCSPLMYRQARGSSKELWWYLTLYGRAAIGAHCWLSDRSMQLALVTVILVV